MTNKITPKLFTMPPLVMGIILGAYGLAVLIAASLGFGMTGELAEVSRTSLWKCNNSNTTIFDNNTCSGADFARYNTTVRFTSPQVSKLQKTLLVSLVLEHVGNWTTVTSTNMSVDVIITGLRQNITKEIVANDQNVSIHVYCPNASKWCNPAVLNHINALKCDYYDMNFSLLRTGNMLPNETRAPWIGDVIVLLQSAHVSYTYTSMFWGPCVSILLIAAMIVFGVTCVRVHGWTLQFRWIMILLGTCVLFNRPLEVLSVYLPGWTFELFEQLCVSTFVVLLCGFWLTLFRAANDKNKKVRYFDGVTTQQKIVKLVFYILPIIFSTAITTWQRLHDRDAYDLLNLFGYEVLCAALIVVMCFYTGVTFYALFRIDAEYDPELMTIGNHRRRMIFYVVSFAVLLITMLDYLIGMLVPSFLDHLGRDVFVSVLLSGYVIVLLIFSLPAAKRKHYKVNTKNNVITITETDEDTATDTQSIDTSGAPHSSFSIDFTFSRPDGVGVPMSPSLGRSTSSSSTISDTMPVPKSGIIPSSEEVTTTNQSDITTESADDSSDTDSDEIIISDV